METSKTMTDVVDTAVSEEVHNSTGGTVIHPKRSIFGVTVPHYASPMTQIVIAGCILFLNPGMYNALAGLGGAGQVDATVQNNAGIGLHSAFAVFGLIVGSINNYIGVRWTMAIGGIGYSVYSASFLCYNHTKNEGFVIFAGTLLGICGAFLWCAQGVVMMSYPTEAQKGRAISITWLLFNLGSVIGAAITAGQNWHVKKGPVTDGTYVAFIVIETLGAILCFCLAPGRKVIRSDGTQVQKIVHPGIKEEFAGLYKTLISDPWIVLLFPMFFASNYFYTYQFNDVNAYWFTTRTRAFNNVLYWISQIFAAGIFGLFLDWSRLSRRVRTGTAWLVMFVLVNAIWGGGLAFEKKTSRSHKGPGMDIYDHNYTWYLVLYMAYGLLDAMWQSFCYYTMGALSNDPRKLAYYTGFYKSVQAVGAAAISKMDGEKLPLAGLFGSCWGLMAGGLLFALPVYIWRIKDTEASEGDTDDMSCKEDRKVDMVS